MLLYSMLVIYWSRGRSVYYSSMFQLHNLLVNAVQKTQHMVRELLNKSDGFCCWRLIGSIVWIV